MIIKSLLLGHLPTNCYIVSDERTNEALIIDPAGEPEKIQEYINNCGLRPLAIVLTHGHYDHISGVEKIQSIYQIPCLCGEREVELLESPELNLSGSFGRKKVVVHPNQLLKDGEEVKIGSFDFKTISTPGHTAGGICIYFENDNVLFSGDTLFKGTIGRTDLPTGSYNEILRSVNDVLAKLPEETVVYPGHGFKTKIELEKIENPYIRE